MNIQTQQQVNHECQRFVSYMLQQPNFTLEHPNVVQHAREQLGLVHEPNGNRALQSYQLWQPMIKELITSRPLIVVTKTNPAQPPNVMRLQHELLRQDANIPFYTPALQGILQQALKRENINNPEAIQPPKFNSDIKVTAPEIIIKIKQPVA